MTNEVDIGSLEKNKVLQLLPPSDPRVQCAIAPMQDEMLEEHGFEDREALSKKMIAAMQAMGGVGLTCNQVGLPFNFFCIGGHPDIESGLTLKCFNPIIVSSGDEEINMTEGCLTFPFVFLNLKRPRKIVVKYEDEKGDLKEAHLDGIMSRIFQHEMDHILGRTFTEHASQLKLERAFKKAEKQFDKLQRARR